MYETELQLFSIRFSQLPLLSSSSSIRFFKSESNMTSRALRWKPQHRIKMWILQFRIQRNEIAVYRRGAAAEAGEDGGFCCGERRRKGRNRQREMKSRTEKVHVKPYASILGLNLNSSSQSHTSFMFIKFRSQSTHLCNLPFVSVDANNNKNVITLFCLFTTRLYVDRACWWRCAHASRPLVYCRSLPRPISAYYNL